MLYNKILWIESFSMSHPVFWGHQGHQGSSCNGSRVGECLLSPQKTAPAVVSCSSGYTSSLNSSHTWFLTEAAATHGMNSSLNTLWVAASPNPLDWERVGDMDLLSQGTCQNGRFLSSSLGIPHRYVAYFGHLLHLSLHVSQWFWRDSTCSQTLFLTSQCARTLAFGPEETSLFLCKFSSLLKRFLPYLFLPGDGNVSFSFCGIF